MPAAQVSASKKVKSPKGLPVFKVAADKGTHPPVELDRAVCVVGRRGSAHLPLSAPQVSKVHALIVRDEQSGHVYLRDLASTNGVEVNGAKVSEAELGDADVVRIGAYTLRCESGFGEKNGEDVNGTADAPTAELRVAGQSVTLSRGKHTLLIGHRPACDVRLEDNSVAPVHAIVFEMDGRHYVRAFEAPGGTKINGRAVEQQQELVSGDEIKVGKFTIQYEKVAPPPAPIAADDDYHDVTPVELDDHHGDEISGDSLVDLALTGEIEPDASHSHADVIEVGESAITPAVEAAERAPAGTPGEAPPALPIDHREEAEIEVELEPLAVEAEVSSAASHDELVALEPLADVAERKPVAPVPAPPKRAETPPLSKKSAPAPKAVAAPADDFHVVDDDDLTDITPFDIGTVEPESESVAAPYVDPAMEASFGAALKFDPATVSGEQDDFLASLVTPNADDADMNATFDESSGMSAVSPMMEAPRDIVEPESISPLAEKEAPAAESKPVGVAPMAAVEDEHDDDDDLDLIELSTPRSGSDELSATLDERDDVTPLAVETADADAAAEIEPQPAPLAESHQTVAPALTASTGGQAAGLAALAEEAGLSPEAGVTPGLDELSTMLGEVVAKVDALKVAFAAYQVKVAAVPGRIGSDAEAE